MKIIYDKYFYLGIFFSIIQILVLIRNYLLEDHILFFYYCDNIALFLAIAFFIRNVPLIKALVSVGLLLQVIYALDLISGYGFGVFIIGTTEYLVKYSWYPLVVSMLMHFATAFIAFVYVFKEKNNYTSLIYAFVYLCFLYFTTILLTHPDYDMNCIYHGCGVGFLAFDWYTTFWIPLAFFFVILPTHYFQELVYCLYHKYKK